MKNKGGLDDKEFKLLIDRIDNLIRRQDIETSNLKNKFEETKKQTIMETKSNINEVKELKLSDIKSLP
jgi:hypothetical protein